MQLQLGLYKSYLDENLVLFLRKDNGKHCLIDDHIKETLKVLADDEKAV